MSIFERSVLIITSILVIIGIISSNINVHWYENTYVVEDGFIENLTVVPLLIVFFYALKVLFKKEVKQKSWKFKSVWFIIALFSLFVAGEEISWGQRIFQIETPEFFQQHNAQNETNLHNMMIGEYKINKIVFSKMINISIAIYLLAFPYFFRKNKNFKVFLNNRGIPVAQNYQIIACIILFISILFIPTGKNAELLEGGICLLFMLIMLFPYNRRQIKPWTVKTEIS